MFSLSELAKIHKQKMKCKTKTYEVILNKCYNQIRHMAYRDQTFCYYIVPLYVMGLPLYDINACIVYILVNLKKKGFLVQMSNPQTIYISWKHIYDKQHTPSTSLSTNHKSNKPINNQRYIQQTQPMITYRPQNQMNRFIERSKNLL